MTLEREFIKILAPNFYKGFTKNQLRIMNIESKNIVFEISQKTIVKDYEKFKLVHRHYKNQDYRTAVSKVGNSHIAIQGVSETSLNL